jgi:hypothetical protein
VNSRARVVDISLFIWSVWNSNIEPVLVCLCDLKSRLKIIRNHIFKIWTVKFEKKLHKKYESYIAIEVIFLVLLNYID